MVGIAISLFSLPGAFSRNGVAIFSFIYLSHFFINFKKLSAYLAQNFLNFIILPNLFDFDKANTTELHPPKVRQTCKIILSVAACSCRNVDIICIFMFIFAAATVVLNNGH